jgi:transcriptional regulator with XRE-family HTH domain
VRRVDHRAALLSAFDEDFGFSPYISGNSKEFHIFFLTNFVLTRNVSKVARITRATEVCSGLRKLSMATMMAPVASREVLRCDHCSLVQFSTSNLQCRRCHKPLEVEAPETTVSSPVEVMGPRASGNRSSKVAVRLREIRNARHLSQRQLAARLDVPRTYISKIENGRAMPTLSSLQRLAAALAVPMCEMVHDVRFERERDIAAMMEDPFIAEISVWISSLDPLHRAMVLSHIREMATGGRRTA